MDKDTSNHAGVNTSLNLDIKTKDTADPQCKKNIKQEFNDWDWWQWGNIYFMYVANAVNRGKLIMWSSIRKKQNC